MNCLIVFCHHYANRHRVGVRISGLWSELSTTDELRAGTIDEEKSKNNVLREESRKLLLLKEGFKREELA